MTIKKFLLIVLLVELITLPLTFSSQTVTSHKITPKEGKDILTTHSKLKSMYRQDEKLIVNALLFNNKSQEEVDNTVNITSLWLLLTRKIEQRTSRPEKRVSKNFTYLLLPNESQTIQIHTTLSDAPPATYNVTSYFEDSEGLKHYVMEDNEIEVRSSLQIPPIAYLLIGIMGALILVFIGYYFSGKFGS